MQEQVNEKTVALSVKATKLTAPRNTNIIRHSMRQLESAVNGAKEALGADRIEALADKGYRSDSEVFRCLLNGDTPNVYCHDKRNCYQFEFKQTETQISPEMTASRKPETVLACIEAGVMPDVLRDKNVTIDVVIPAANLYLAYWRTAKWSGCGGDSHTVLPFSSRTALPSSLTSGTPCSNYSNI